MSITDELRRALGRIRIMAEEQDGCSTLYYISPTVDELTAIADRIEERYERALRESYDNGYASADDWLGQHEDAMAEHGWVRGPLDKDGKLWSSGDMSDSNWGEIEDIAYEDGRWLIRGHDTSAPWIPADSIGHYHAPTVEDVLREFAEKMNENLGMYTGEAIDADEWREADARTVEKYAAKLRLAGDAE